MEVYPAETKWDVQPSLSNQSDHCPHQMVEVLHHFIAGQPPFISKRGEKKTFEAVVRCFSQCSCNLIHFYWLHLVQGPNKKGPVSVLVVLNAMMCSWTCCMFIRQLCN